MNERTKREIKGLVRGYKEPRGGFSLVWIAVVPIFMQIVISLVTIYKLQWGIATLAIWLSLFVTYFVRHFMRAKKTKALVLLNSFELCLWCHHPFVGLPDRGACTECGKGYDRAASKGLFKDVYQPSFPVPLDHVVYFRKARLWSRALRERDRVRDE